MKVLIIGSDSMIGRALSDALCREGVEIYGTSRRESRDAHIIHLDLKDLNNLNTLPACDIGFLCAAETKLSACRADPIATARINVESQFAIARDLRSRGSFVTFLSTSAVFDGTLPLRPSESKTCPVTPYGAQKALAEERILGLGNRVAVIRLTKVVTSTMTLFRGWMDALLNGEEIMPFHDMVFAPIPMDLVVTTLVRIASEKAEGVFHVSSARDISYAQAAVHVASGLGLCQTLVRPVSARSKGIQESEIPHHTSLDTSRMENLINELPPDPFDVLDRVFSLASQGSLRGPQHAPDNSYR